MNIGHVKNRSKDPNFFYPDLAQPKKIGSRSSYDLIYIGIKFDFITSLNSLIYWFILC